MGIDFISAATVKERHTAAWLQALEDEKAKLARRITDSTPDDFPLKHTFPDQKMAEKVKQLLIQAGYRVICEPKSARPDDPKEAKRIAMLKQKPYVLTVELP